MDREHRLVTARKDKECYGHALTFDGRRVNLALPRFLDTALEMIKLNHIKHLSDSPEIERLETRIKIKG